MVDLFPIQAQRALTEHPILFHICNDQRIKILTKHQEASGILIPGEEELLLLW